jgi:cyclophilin family peptidyl-prolyl cis-trans isomerase
MARTNELDSATDQFYINVKDNPNLDQGKYAVFGKVIDGMDVVDKIREVETGDAEVTARTGMGTMMKTTFEDVPKKQVVIKSIRRVEKK